MEKNVQEAIIGGGLRKDYYLKIKKFKELKRKKDILKFLQDDFMNDIETKTKEFITSATEKEIMIEILQDVIDETIKNKDFCELINKIRAMGYPFNEEFEKEDSSKFGLSYNDINKYFMSATSFKLVVMVYSTINYFKREVGEMNERLNDAHSSIDSTILFLMQSEYLFFNVLTDFSFSNFYSFDVSKFVGKIENHIERFATIERTSMIVSEIVKIFIFLMLKTITDSYKDIMDVKRYLSAFIYFSISVLNNKNDILDLISEDLKLALDEGIDHTDTGKLFEIAGKFVEDLIENGEKYLDLEDFGYVFELQKRPETPDINILHEIIDTVKKENVDKNEYSILRNSGMLDLLYSKYGGEIDLESKLEVNNYRCEIVDENEEVYKYLKQVVDNNNKHSFKSQGPFAILSIKINKNIFENNKDLFTHNFFDFHNIREYNKIPFLLFYRLVNPIENNNVDLSRVNAEFRAIPIVSIQFKEEEESVRFFILCPILKIDELLRNRLLGTKHRLKVDYLVMDEELFSEDFQQRIKNNLNSEQIGKVNKFIKYVNENKTEDDDSFVEIQNETFFLEKENYITVINNFISDEDVTMEEYIVIFSKLYKEAERVLNDYKIPYDINRNIIDRNKYEDGIIYN